MKKRLFSVFTAVFITTSLFTACKKEEKPLAIYDYPDKEETLSCCIEQTEYFDNRLEVTFSEDTLDKVESVVCRNENFEDIVDEAEFEVKNDVLTVFHDNPLEISGLRVTVHQEKYFDIRYLDSDSYAMLLYTWADDIGMMPNGDKDAYYTEEEKRKQAERAAERAAKTETAFALLEGIWENEDGTVRLEIEKEWIYEPALEHEREYRLIKLFELQDGKMLPTEWFSADTVDVYDTKTEPVEIEVIQHDALDYLTSYYLYNNMTEMECSITEERLVKVQ